MSNFKIDGVDIKNPTGFTKERYKVTNMERIANADMVGDLIAKKRKYLFTYSAISSTDLDNILNLIWGSDALFYTLEYIENGVTKTASVYVGSIPAELYRGASSDVWVWQNVTFSLIER